MKRSLVLMLLPILAAAVILGCGDDETPSPTAPASSSSSTGDVNLTSTERSQSGVTLTAPTPREPAVGEQVEELQPTLVIGNATGGTGTRTYAFEVALDAAFQQLVVGEADVTEGLGGVTNWLVPEPFEPGVKYFWRVRAGTATETGPFSEVAEFLVRDGFTRDRAAGGLVLFDPLIGGSVGDVVGGQFLENGWQALSNADCVRYQVPQLQEGTMEFQTTNLSEPNPVRGKRMLLSMWDPSKGEYRDNPFRVHLQKMDMVTVNRWDVRLRWISRGQEANTGISFFDFEPEIVYNWRMEWGTFPGIQAQHVKVFLDGFEILSRNYDRPYRPNPHWVELGQCEREETLEEAIWSNVRIGTR